MFFKIQKFPENLRADFLKLFIQVFLSHISALPNTNLYSPFSIFWSVSRLLPTATADTPMWASSWTCSSVIAFNALHQTRWFADIVGKLSFYQILLVTNPTRLSSVWLTIRFKITTSCTWAFLLRIIVYNRYVWAFIPYTTIYIAYIRVFNTRICAKSNARLYALLKTRIYAYLSKPTYTRAKMCIYAGFRNQTWYKMARKVPLTE